MRTFRASMLAEVLTTFGFLALCQDDDVKNTVAMMVSTVRQNHTL